jgi:glucokinase
MDTFCVIGVDLGGTNVRSAVYEHNSGKRISEIISASSRAKEGVESCINAISEVITQSIDDSGREPQIIGMAVPGHIQEGVVRWAPNFGEWKNGLFEIWSDVPLAKKVSESLNVPVYLGNDANLAALGEFRYGCGRNSSECLVMFTLGTGIGFGVVFGKKSLSWGLSSPAFLVGANSGGAEGGHMVICKDGLPHPTAAPGTVEAYCGTDAIVSLARKRFHDKQAAILRELCENDETRITPKILSLSADNGDMAAKSVWKEMGENLGVGIANAINLFAPEIIALGGQIARASNHFLPSAIESAKRYSIPTLFNDTTIQIAEHIEDAGLIGASALASHYISGNHEIQ